MLISSYAFWRLQWFWWCLMWCNLIFMMFVLKGNFDIFWSSNHKRTPTTNPLLIFKVLHDQWRLLLKHLIFEHSWKFSTQAVILLYGMINYEKILCVRVRAGELYLLDWIYHKEIPFQILHLRSWLKLSVPTMRPLYYLRSTLMFSVRLKGADCLNHD